MLVLLNQDSNGHEILAEICCIINQVEKCIMHKLYLFFSYFVEYQFPVVASSRDRSLVNAMATEVMRLVSKKVTDTGKFFKCLPYVHLYLKLHGISWWGFLWEKFLHDDIIIWNNHVISRKCKFLFSSWFAHINVISVFTMYNKQPVLGIISATNLRWIR